MAMLRKDVRRRSGEQATVSLGAGSDDEPERNPVMSPLGAQVLARAALTYLAEPGDPALGALLEVCDPAEVLAAIKAGMLPDIGAAEGPSTGAGPRTVDGDSSGRRRALERALGRWRVRLADLPGDAAIQDACRAGLRLVCPGDPEWPASLDELGLARPYALWLRGRANLRLACLRSVSMVGSRAATGYGSHVAGEIAADLAEQGWVIVSGGAYTTKSHQALDC
jgi:DNA processing protein